MISVRLPLQADRDRLLAWRNRDAVRTVSLSQSLIEPEQHQAWFSKLLLEREGQLGIVCNDERPVGVIQLDQLDLQTSEATWGCHLGEIDVAPGFGATLPILGIALGLRGWGLKQLNAEVMAANKNMLGIHRRLAIRRIEPDPDPAKADEGPAIQAIQFQVSQDELPAILGRADRLFPRALAASLASAVTALESWRNH